MRCLITGASGHLGSFVVRRLIEQGAQVVILVRPQSDLWRLTDVLQRVKVVYGDLANLDTASTAIMRHTPEFVFHLAWYGVTGEYRNAAEQITHNVLGSLRLFELARAAGCRCWIGIGSQAEYGPYEGLLSEDLPTRPVTTYGVSKLCAGLLTQKLCELAGIRCVWLRLLATYGPKDDPRHLIPTVIEQLLQHQQPALTPGEQKWDYLYVEDAAKAICRVAMVEEASGIFNLGSGEAYPVRDIVERIRDLINPSAPLGFGEIPYRVDQVMHLQADISRLVQVTGWRPAVDLEQGLRQTVEWHRSKAEKS